MLRKITATLMALAVAGGGALMTATFGAVKAPRPLAFPGARRRPGRQRPA